MTFMYEQHSIPANIPAFYVYKMCNRESLHKSSLPQAIAEYLS